jgi:hypothetical protein
MGQPVESRLVVGFAPSRRCTMLVVEDAQWEKGTDREDAAIHQLADAQVDARAGEDARLRPRQPVMLLQVAEDAA